MSVRPGCRVFLRRGALGLFLGGALAAGPSSVPVTTVETDVRHDPVVETVERVMPSVVNIITETVVEPHDFYQELLREFYGPQTTRIIGSGVIVDEDGYIVTNYHVVRDWRLVQVKLWDGRVCDADPIVATPNSDVALLKLRLKPGEKKDFQAIRLARDDDLLLGETVLALGNPYGLGGSVSRGILSSKDRRPATGNEPLKVENWLQTDASINPGNSGGPLVDLRGELIGINVAVYREQQGMGVGFAIPIKQIRASLAQFFAPEVSDSLWLGTRISGWTAPLTVASVQTGSPADKAGLAAGQQILTVNGQAPRSLIDFNHLVTANEDHSAVVQVRQNGQPRSLTVKLVPFDDLIRQKLGLALELNPSPRIAARFPERGLFIATVQPGGPADNANVKPEYLLTGIDGRTANDPNSSFLLAVADVLSSKKPGDVVQLSVLVPRRINNNYVEFRQATVPVPVR